MAAAKWMQGIVVPAEGEFAALRAADQLPVHATLTVMMLLSALASMPFFSRLLSMSNVTFSTVSSSLLQPVKVVTPANKATASIGCRNLFVLMSKKSLSLEDL